MRKLISTTITAMAVAGCYVQQPQAYPQQAQSPQAYDGQAPSPGAQPGATQGNANAVAYDPTAQQVFVNGLQIDQGTLLRLAQLGLPIPSGTYWYDRVSGAFGQVGGPTALFIYPNLNLGGPLSEDASNGTSQVVINGRRLTAQEVMFLSQVIGAQIQPGRYWLDAQGNTGFEGGPALANVVQLAQQNAAGGYQGGYQGSGQGGGQPMIQSGWGGTYSSDGNCYYISTGSGSVMGPGC